MAIEQRARGYVKRANDALADVGRAEEIWTESIRSATDEMRVHSLSIALDNAIRKVEGPFDYWLALDPSVVELIAQSGPLKLLQVLSAHSNGRVREAFIKCTKDRVDNEVLPHLANRAVDFVPAVRQLAAPLVGERLARELAARSGPGPHGVLNTPTHIAVTKLLSPRTAKLNPQLVRPCIDLALSTATSRPGCLKEEKLDQMLDRCRQTSASIVEPQAIQALEELVAFFNANAEV